ncbi:TM2 domain-containing protein [Corynebacterium sp.]|uniref:TM2 domain-containing protein n=1 Tax=Corynebacterium sp. TaxID=1720 RepID=UPI0025BA70E6|nr:TM2 domain-containing protein [Corynebacterium sp.]
MTEPEQQGNRGPRDSGNGSSAENGGGRWSGEYAPGSYDSPASTEQTQVYGVNPGQGEPLPGYPGQSTPPNEYGQYSQYGQPGAYGAAAAYPGHPAPPLSRKKKVVAALLAFFVGGTGAHNFYIGNKGRAIAQLVLLVVTWVLVIAGYGLVIAGAGTESVTGYSGQSYYVDEDPGMIIAGGIMAILGYLTMGGLWIWTMVEFIMILTTTGRYGRDRDGYQLA